MNSIFRFTSFHTLVDIIQKQALTLVKPEKWGDPYEGYVLRAMRTEEGIKKAYKLLNDPDKYLNLIQGVGKYYFGQCWTKKKESDALWRIYSYDNQSIRIEVDRDIISGIKHNEYKITVEDVYYEKELDLEKELRYIIKGSTVEMARIFLIKRRAFKHEKEVRVLVWDNKEENNTIHLSFKGINNFIKSVMLNPLAPDWLDGTIKTFCDINSLNYLGKSDLYKFKIK